MERENSNQKIERTILDPDVVIKLEEISKQIESELGDLVKVTQKVLVNFIVRNRIQLLSPEEMKLFLSENYDLIKALKKATLEAVKARQSGSEIEISEILKLIQTPSVNSNQSLKKARGRKRKEDSGPAISDSFEQSNASIDKLKKRNTGHDKNLIADTQSDIFEAIRSLDSP